VTHPHRSASTVGLALFAATAACSSAHSIAAGSAVVACTLRADRTVGLFAGTQP
jgi:hypothetical protein